VLFILQEILDDQGRKYWEMDKSKKGIKFKVIFDFILQLVYRNLANFDSMVLLTADKGTGKSSAAIMMAKIWCKIIGIRFDPDRHIAYSNADVMHKIEKLNKYEPLIADESANFASSADWAKTENKALRKKIAQVRTRRLFFILCFPMKVKKMEKTYLESFVNIWIDLFGRGVGACYIKDKNPVNDSWRLDDFKKLGSFTDFTNINEIERKLKRHPNFWKVLKFPKTI